MTKIAFLLCVCFFLLPTSEAMLPQDDSGRDIILRSQEFNVPIEIVEELSRESQIRQESFETRLEAAQTSEERINLMRETIDFEDLFVKYANEEDIRFYSNLVVNLINGNLDKNRITYGEKLFISNFIANGILMKLFSRDIYDISKTNTSSPNLSKAARTELRLKISNQLSAEINALGENAVDKLTQIVVSFVEAKKKSNDVRENIQMTFSISKENQYLIAFGESYLSEDNVTYDFYKCCLSTFEKRKAVSQESIFLIRHSYNKIEKVRFYISKILNVYLSPPKDISVAVFIVKFVSLNNNIRNITKIAKEIYFKLANMYLNEDCKEVMYSLLHFVYDNPAYIFFLLQEYWEKRTPFHNDLRFFQPIYEYGMDFYKKHKKYFDELEKLSAKERHILQMNLFPEDNGVFDFENLKEFLESQKTDHEVFMELINDFPTLVNVMNIFMFATLLPLTSAMSLYFPIIQADPGFWNEIANDYAFQTNILENVKNIIFDSINN